MGEGGTVSPDLLPPCFLFCFSGTVVSSVGLSGSTGGFTGPSVFVAGVPGFVVSVFVVVVSCLVGSGFEPEHVV